MKMVERDDVNVNLIQRSKRVEMSRRDPAIWKPANERVSDVNSKESITYEMRMS